MGAKSIQRTLIVGLGGAGVQVAGALSKRLVQTLGPIGMIETITVRNKEAGRSSNKDQPAAEEQQDRESVEISTATPHTAHFTFQSQRPARAEAPPGVGGSSPVASPGWQNDFEALASIALRQISRLDHLTALAQHGLILRRPDEVQLILIATLDETWVSDALAQTVTILRKAVLRTLACQAGFIGLLLTTTSLAPPVNDPAEPALMTNIFHPATLPPSHPFTLSDLFDRGCFLAGLTNEVGLTIGGLPDLVSRTAHFLALLITSPLGMEADSKAEALAEWQGIPAASFGLASIRWPGEAMIEALSARWAGEALAHLIAPSSAAGNLAEPARLAAQGLLLGERLTPPALLEQLAGLMPALPASLAEQVPDSFWPWSLAGIQARLESEAQNWLETWLAGRPVLAPVLAAAETAWQNTARRWLPHQLERTTTGAVTQLEASLAAVTELLAAFLTGLIERLEEAEMDLALVEQQLSRSAAALATNLALLPDSPLAALLQWGPHPGQWWRYWTQCRQARLAARQFAHLLRQRLLILQMIWLYEEALPFYRSLSARWAGLVQAWTQIGQQISQAAQTPALSTWSERLTKALAASGPWTAALVETLYEAALTNQPELAGFGNLPTLLSQWVEAGLTAAEIENQLRQRAATFLTSQLAIPVDLALAQQFPDPATQTDWLAAFMAQAQPFWPYDEAGLDEIARARSHWQSWLFLPGGEASPLVPLIQNWTRPPQALAGPTPAELVAVTIRWEIN